MLRRKRIQKHRTKHIYGWEHILPRFHGGPRYGRPTSCALAPHQKEHTEDKVIIRPFKVVAEPGLYTLPFYNVLTPLGNISPTIAYQNFACYGHSENAFENHLPHVIRYRKELYSFARMSSLNRNCIGKEANVNAMYEPMDRQWPFIKFPRAPDNKPHSWKTLRACRNIFWLGTHSLTSPT